MIHRFASVHVLMVHESQNHGPCLVCYYTLRCTFTLFTIQAVLHIDFVLIHRCVRVTMCVCFCRAAAKIEIRVLEQIRTIDDEGRE